MKAGDLIKLKPCSFQTQYGDCVCVYCSGKSTRVGIIVEIAYWENSYRVLFDIGLKEVMNTNIQQVVS